VFARGNPVERGSRVAGGLAGPRVWLADPELVSRCVKPRFIGPFRAVC